MSIIKGSSLALLLMLPIVSQAEGGGDRVIERYEKKRDAQIVKQASNISEKTKSVSEPNTTREKSED